MIKTFNVFAVVVGLVVAGPVVVQADIVTEEFIFQVNHVEPSAFGYFHDGDIFQYTISYDTDGTYRSLWEDGVNGIAEFGDGDDVLLGHVGLDPTGVYKSDASFIFDDQTNDYLNTFTDDTNINYAYFGSHTGPFDYASYSGDGVLINIDTRDNIYTLGLYDDDPGEIGGPGPSLVSAIILNRTVVVDGQEPVPEPATMLLFGTGLAGLAGYRKRKAMKK